ncbi:probable LRR receptor-like serine/threonine-protein kinase At4g36180 [Lactuca sativa]|uniref:Leucine-rich repeat-containing N-terminal plant-type domain-containing protein n=1 Tax=Lactuca sativa TaxID=4236 RepID=A0A9R1WN59_LACSA|nr:probable LRR receptor-like serine/threonine-protein kinase At4g36180 [Lactuca sativa]KAJ0225795.1 hypothetical protein LSAT_V11C100021620 [Lactuca sativa]
MASAALTFILIVSIFAAAAAICHPDDEQGLLSFKSGITADPSGILSSWKPATDCCNWSGISCQAPNNRVNSISLYGQLDKPNSYLSGTISSSLSKLRFLDGIYFQNTRNISGPLPGVLFNLPNLQYVYIENNKLSGRLPENLGNLTRLYALSLEGNGFSGSIPSSISKLTELSQLKLGGNQLTGTVPDGIRQLKSLSLLALDRNKLTGSIPDFFTSFSNLRVLRLSYNRFSGNIPASISSLAPVLAYLELGHNLLTGRIPDFLGNFRALDTLDLSSNGFSGTVPKSFGNLTKIFNLDLSRNKLTDPFPVMNVKGIESLDLSYNGFHLKQIPKWVSSSPIIYSLKLAKCGIQMKLDDWNPSETYFYDYIDLSENNITGSPVKLLNRTNYLVGFGASGNQLKFNLESLKFPTTLKTLDLSRNLMIGKVPKAVTGLQSLNVSHNGLCGSLPPTKFPSTSFVGNACLCGPPLAACKV